VLYRQVTLTLDTINELLNDNVQRTIRDPEERVSEQGDPPVYCKHSEQVIGKRRTGTLSSSYRPLYVVQDRGVDLD
jgi:hypothetical protein